MVTRWWAIWLLGATLAIGIGLLLGYTVERPVMVYRSRFLRRLTHAQKPATQHQTKPMLGIQQ